MIQIITEMIIFLSYILVCTALFKRRFSMLATLISFGAAMAVVVGINTVIIMSDNVTFALTLMPLTAYIPFSVLLYFLSDCGVFETAAFCSVGMLDVLILRSLSKILIRCFSTSNIRGYVYDAIILALVAVTALGIGFIAFRFIGKAFRVCIIENHQNRLLLSIPIALIFLMMFYFLNSTTDIVVLILTMFIALSVFLITAKLMISTSELIRMKRSEKEIAEYMEVQRRGYDRAVRKMESNREFRHDMRHHLAIIEGLAKQGDCNKIIEYTGKMNGSLNNLESVNYCKNSEINAVLSEYISRAENAGCKVTQNVALSENLPFEEDNVCIVLANSIENAINACLKLTEGKRYINISVECVDGHRLLVAVENPSAEEIFFDETGMPIIDGNSNEHGIGLRSVKNIAEKYNGFLQCKLEKGVFVFHAALFYDESASKEKSVKCDSTPKRAMSSLLGFGLGILVALNLLPAAADAVSSLLSVNIHTIRNLRLSYGDNSISIDRPEFEGNGADSLNTAVNDYVGEAREKFMWYFNRRYSGYVAEEMRYTVIRDDEKYFTVQFNTTINAGGSMDYSRWVIFDKSAGKVLELGDLFKENTDFTGVISTEILEQMKYKNEHEGGAFFTEGDDCFTEISEEANFYIDSFDRLVIVFDEYEVAPGFMGSPEFIIPDKILEEIVR